MQYLLQDKMSKAITVGCVSLSGGQGKSTLALMLAKKLSRTGKKVLLVDCDPQASLTFWLGISLEPTNPSLLEALVGEVRLVDAIYQTSCSNLYAIPADDALNKAQDFLTNSGMGALLLRERLKEIMGLFDLCILDSPPQRTQIVLSVLGASDRLLIPVEATTKGVQSLDRSLDLVAQMKKFGAFQGQIMGIVPFRDRWVGAYRTKDSRDAIEAMEKVAPSIKILPSILESQKYKEALRLRKTVLDMGFPDLEHSFEKITQLL